MEIISNTKVIFIHKSLIEWFEFYWNTQWLVIDETMEHLEGIFWLSLRDHMTSTLHSQQSQWVILLIETSMMFVVSIKPWFPFSFFLSFKNIKVLLAVSEGYYIIPITIKHPYSDCFVQEDFTVLLHWARFCNMVV